MLQCLQEGTYTMRSNSDMARYWIRKVVVSVDYCISCDGLMVLPAYHHFTWLRTVITRASEYSASNTRLSIKNLLQPPKSLPDMLKLIGLGAEVKPVLSAKKGEVARILREMEQSAHLKPKTLCGSK